MEDTNALSSGSQEDCSYEAGYSFGAAVLAPPTWDWREAGCAPWCFCSLTCWNLPDQMSGFICCDDSFWIRCSGHFSYILIQSVPWRSWAAAWCHPCITWEFILTEPAHMLPNSVIGNTVFHQQVHLLILKHTLLVIYCYTTCWMGKYF